MLLRPRHNGGLTPPVSAPEASRTGTERQHAVVEPLAGRTNLPPDPHLAADGRPHRTGQPTRPARGGVRAQAAPPGDRRARRPTGPEGVNERGDQRGTGGGALVHARATTLAPKVPPARSVARPRHLRRRRDPRRGRTLLRLGCAVSILAGAGVVIAVARSGDPPPAFASDDFNRSALGPQWTVADPLGDSTVATEGTWTRDAWLRIEVPGPSRARTRRREQRGAGAAAHR
jgi:hypothetical protein